MVKPQLSGVRVVIEPLEPPPAASHAQFNWVFDTSVRVNVGSTAPALAGWGNHAVIIATINAGNIFGVITIVFIGVLPFLVGIEKLAPHSHDPSARLQTRASLSTGKMVSLP